MRIKIVCCEKEEEMLIKFLDVLKRYTVPTRQDHASDMIILVESGCLLRCKFCTVERLDRG